MSKHLHCNPFDCTVRKYRDLASNVVNHLLSSNQGYGKILWVAQHDRAPITYERLTTMQVPGLAINWFWITRSLYTFLFDLVTPAFQRSLPRRAGKTEEHNGLELWGKLVFDYEGGAMEVEVQEC